MNVLVTGGAGFIGAALAERLSGVWPVMTARTPSI